MSGMFTIFECGTGKRLSDRSYATTEEAKHDYHMNQGHSYIGIVPEYRAIHSAINLAFLKAELEMSAQTQTAIDFIGERLAKLKREVEGLYSQGSATK